MRSHLIFEAMPIMCASLFSEKHFHHYTCTCSYKDDNNVLMLLKLHVHCTCVEFACKDWYTVKCRLFVGKDDYYRCPDLI